MQSPSRETYDVGIYSLWDFSPSQCTVHTNLHTDSHIDAILHRQSMPLMIDKMVCEQTIALKAITTVE